MCKHGNRTTTRFVAAKGGIDFKNSIYLQFLHPSLNCMLSAMKVAMDLICIVVALDQLKIASVAVLLLSSSC